MSSHGSPHEATVRNVIGTAREVRIRLRDAHVIFASTVPAEEANRESFVVRPWGVSSTRRFLFDDVSRAAPVQHMSWEKERAICAAQAHEFSCPLP